MMKQLFLKLFSNHELIIKITIVISLFLSTFFVFKLFQKPAIIDSTLNKISHSYVRDAVNKNYVWKKTDQTFYYRDEKNTLRWDGKIYYDISKNYYNNGDWKYCFFPLFPLVWKLSHISAIYIGLFNYLLFGFSVILLSMLFFNITEISLIEKLYVFSISLLLPPIVIYYLPYAEALFMITFVLAIFGLMKKKYWLFFISILLFTMSRPIFTIIGLSFIIIDSLYFIKHKNAKYFIKELLLKLLPVIIGTFIVFYMFFLNSGSFNKYFESHHKYWNITFSIPHKISDWSIESFGMNVFTIFFILLPASIIFFLNFFKTYKKSETTEIPSIFNGDKIFIKEYLYHISLMYFFGVFAFIFFYQGGSLNGLHRYILDSPFFYIFLFYSYQKLRKVKAILFFSIISCLLIAALILFANSPKLEPSLDFNDSGFFTLFLDLIFLYSLKYMNNLVKFISFGIVALYNIIWITYLYNIYLCDGWIFT